VNGVASYPLIITADDIARHLGLPLPLDASPEWTLSEASRAAQSDLAAYLGRQPVPVAYTDYHREAGRGGWRLDNYPVLSVDQVTPEADPVSGQPTGLFTIRYTAGLDGAGDPELEPIRRFIRLHAMFDPTVQILFRAQRPDIATRVLSASLEGQSATITDTYPAMSGASMRSPAAVTASLTMPGSMPTLASCDRWRISRRRVHQRPSRPGQTAPWPYDPPGEGEWDTYDGARRTAW
jgi:hypothetical protein